MRRDDIKKWFETVLACSGSEFLEHQKQVNINAGGSFVERFLDDPAYADQAREWQPLDDSFYNESFIDNFDQLYRPEIISMINRYIVSDVREFYRLFDAFVTDIKAAFVLSDDLAGKRDLVKYITPELDTIRVAANRLANALRKKWNTADDPRYERAILSQQGSQSSSSFALLITAVQSQIKRQRSDNQSLNIGSPANLNRYNKPDQDYLYLAMLLTQKTEECLVSTGWFKPYACEPYPDTNGAVDSPEIRNREENISLFGLGSQEQSETISDDKGRFFKSFEELFIDREYIPIAIDALYKIRPTDPIIVYDTRTWRGKRGSIAILAAWLFRLDATNRVHFIRDKKNIIPLLEKFFPKLSLGKDGRSLRDIDEDLVLKFTASILPELTA